jgi:hypothetical protein
MVLEWVHRLVDKLFTVELDMLLILPTWIGKPRTSLRFSSASIPVYVHRCWDDRWTCIILVNQSRRPVLDFPIQDGSFNSRIHTRKRTKEPLHPKACAHNTVGYEHKLLGAMVLLIFFLYVSCIYVSRLSHALLNRKSFA